MLTWSEEIQISATMRELLSRMSECGDHHNEWLESSYQAVENTLNGMDSGLPVCEVAGVDCFTHAAWTLVYEMSETGFAESEPYKELVGELVPLFESVGLNCNPNVGWLDLKMLAALGPDQQAVLVRQFT